MRFDSLLFAAFFAVFLALYWSLRSHNAQNLLILVGSYIFYGWWDWRFLSLLAATTVVDFAVARAIEQRRALDLPTRRVLFVSIGMNLAVLGAFKYYDFFSDSLQRVCQTLGFNASLPLLHVVLPLGISFYTFQTLSYTIDVYRGRQVASASLLKFAAYIAFFPQLVAGPIERAARLLPRFDEARSLDVTRWRSAASLMVFGLVKKIAIADNVAPLADHVFGAPSGSVSGPVAFAGVLAFAVQIYADFSAYSDIARGAARLLGFELSVNFNQPFVSLTPSEFWRRWHISLSEWLRDYLYVPLGGNRRGSLHTYVNLMLTMLLGGLWHGAAWSFVLWGGFHGALLCAYRILQLDDRLARTRTKWARPLSLLVFMSFTLYGWMLFRANSLDQIIELTRALLFHWGSGWAEASSIALVTIYFALPIVVHHWLARAAQGEKWVPKEPWLWRLSLALTIIYGVTHARAQDQAFIYFQF